MYVLLLLLLVLFIKDSGSTYVVAAVVVNKRLFQHSANRVRPEPQTPLQSQVAAAERRPVQLHISADKCLE